MKAIKIIKYPLIICAFIFLLLIIGIVVALVNAYFTCRGLSEINMVRFVKQDIALRIPIEYKQVKKTGNEKFFPVKAKDGRNYFVQWVPANGDIHIYLFNSCLGGFVMMSFTYEIKSDEIKNKISHLIETQK